MKEEDEKFRRRAVTWGLALTRDTPLAPSPHEQRLLAAYVRGELSLDEVIARLEGAELAPVAAA